MYKGNFEAWGKIGRAEGFRGVFTGWSPTFFGYSVSVTFVMHCNTALTSYLRLKVLSNMEVMSFSRNSTPIWPERTELIATRLQSTSPPVLLPSLLPILPCVRLRLSRSGCRQPSHRSPLGHSAVSLPSPAKKARLGKSSPTVRVSCFRLWRSCCRPQAKVRQLVQRALPSLGPSNPVHDDEVCVLRDDRRSNLWLPSRSEIRLR